ncbi:hypothetical protein ZEAMMB73_Zm00001d024484 [Zea mays]|uniref:BED-type domain-containing protein n=1 Tax=Zea mays TaxID=4577 RepID=A0A1D6IZJ5_MAIZE|nr:hypothetical protein ZEAMMB73_Zm00001d024484 [Zea mays]
MDCHGRGKGNEKAILYSGESSGAAGGLSKTYVVTKEGKRIELKGTIKDTWSHGTKRGKLGWKCGYCNASHASGGATRLREHLCGLQGNVKPCFNVPRDVKNILLEEVALSKKKKRDTTENRLYIQKALVEHDYRTTIARLNEEEQLEMAMRESLRDVGLTYDGSSRGSGIVIGATSGSRVSNSVVGNYGQTSGSRSGSSTKQSSLRSFYLGPSSSKAPFDIDLARSRAPSQPRVDIMLCRDSKLKLWKALSKWFHANDIPGRKADCPYFRSAMKLAQQLGEVPLPKGKDIDGQLLDMNYNDLEAHMESFKEDWSRYGQKNATLSGFLPKMIQAYNDISAKLKKSERGKGGLLKRTAEVISKRIRYLLNETLMLAGAALDPQELYRSNLAKKSSCQLAVTLAIKKLATSTKEAAAAIDQFSRFIEKKGLFGDPEAKWSALNGKPDAADFQSLQEKDSDPCSMLMDVALYDDQNPIMDWLNNSMSDSAPTLDEYDDSDLDWSTPSSFVTESLQMGIEEVAGFKRDLYMGKKVVKTNRECNGMEKMLKVPQKTMKLILHKNKAAQFMLSQVTVVPMMKVMVSFNQNFQFTFVINIM